MSVNHSGNKGDAPGCLTIGEGVRVVGHLSVPGLAIINGVLEGELQADELLVGPKGALTGKVKVRTADVHGSTHDMLTATEFLCVRSTGRINGNANYGEIEIEKGGVIQGAIAPAAPAGKGTPLVATPALPGKSDGAR